MPTASPLTERCRLALGVHGHRPDAAQQKAIARLEDLRRRLLKAARPTPWYRAGPLALLARRQPITALRGLYLWGGVGRGKTFLMDLFFSELPIEAKRRYHFHRFMQEVHAGLHRHRNIESPLEQVAAEFAASARVLCFDEFSVSDVADAMVLGALLEALFDHGVALVATSNLPPAQLYRDGLQRARFLPAIALLEQRTEVLEMDGGTDYRLRQLERAQLYLGPAEADPEAALAAEFETLADGSGTGDVDIEVEGRSVRSRREAEDVVWFDFEEICAGPRSAADYIEIARCYHTVLLGGVPVMNAESDDAARRFITLVDEFYDRGVKLILSAAANDPAALYAGERLAFEFRRTASRLVEMQSRDYLARPHRP